MNPKKYMQLCLKLAKLGRTSPNPMVGCVIVKFGRIIAIGYHKKAGTDHAEIVALKKAGKKARGATLIQNLEPCCHYGRTPPCTKAIIKAGIRKVIIAMKDPNPLVAGRGIKELREAGIRVEVGLMEKEARKLNEFFIKYIPNKMPFVILKLAMSIDGKIATRAFESKWVSGEASRDFVHHLRNKVDAVLVGINTILIDNPRLTCHLENGKDPLRVIVDSRLKIPLTANVLADNNVIIATTENCSKKKKSALEKMNRSVIVINKGGKVNLHKLMRILGQLQITSVLVEGGSEISWSAINEKIVDKAYFIIAPKIIGGKNAVAAVGGSGIIKLENAFKLKDVEVNRLGEDILVGGYL